MNPDWFAGRLRELREGAGLSRKDLADRAGMKSEAGVRDLEQGLNYPTWPTVLALAAALGVDCTAFCQSPSPDAPPPRRGQPRKAPADAPPVEAAPVEAAEPPDQVEGAGRKRGKRKGS